MIKKKVIKKDAVTVKKTPITVDEPFITHEKKDDSDTKPKHVAALQYDDVCHHKVVEGLIDYEESVLNKISPKLKDNGFVVYSDNGHGFKINPYNDCWAGAFIPGVACADSDMKDFAACAIVNTLDNGFVYASVDDNDNIEALGPVVTPCIIGNISKPYGIYIPMNNREAIINGVNMAMDFLNTVDNMHVKQVSEKEAMPEIPDNKNLHW